MNKNNQPQVTDVLVKRIWPKQIIKRQKKMDLTYWNETTQQQSAMLFEPKQSKYELAKELTMVRDTKINKTITRYRLSSPGLAVEKGEHKQNFMPEKSGCDKREIKSQSCTSSPVIQMRKKFNPTSTQNF